MIKKWNNLSTKIMKIWKKRFRGIRQNEDFLRKITYYVRLLSFLTIKMQGKAKMKSNSQIIIKLIKNEQVDLLMMLVLQTLNTKLSYHRMVKQVKYIFLQRLQKLARVKET